MQGAQPRIWMEPCVSMQLDYSFGKDEYWNNKWGDQMLSYNQEYCDYDGSNQQMPQENPLFTSHDFDWENHTNFSWEQTHFQYTQQPQQTFVHQNQYEQIYQQPFTQYQYEESPQQFQYQNEQTSQSEKDGNSEMEEMLMQFMEETQSSLKNLESQIHQLSNMVSLQNSETLFSKPEADHLNDTTIRNDKELPEVKKEQMSDIEDNAEKARAEGVQSEPILNKGEPVQNLSEPVLEENEPVQTGIDPVQKLVLNPSDAILKNYSEPKLNQSDPMQNQGEPVLHESEPVHHLRFPNPVQLKQPLPQELKDSGSFSVPFNIGHLKIENAFCDLGAGINVLPYCIYKKLNLGEPQPPRINIQLADRSVRDPRDIVEDVLVKIEKFILPADFVILDIDENLHAPKILRKPFLANDKDLIDEHDGQLILGINDEHVVLKMNETVKYSPHADDPYYVLEAFTENSFLQELKKELSQKEDEHQEAGLNQEKSADLRNPEEVILLDPP